MCSTLSTLELELQAIIEVVEDLKSESGDIHESEDLETRLAFELNLGEAIQKRDRIQAIIKLVKKSNLIEQHG